MGKRGPLPTPTSILKLRGSWRGKKRVDEPAPPAFEGKCPGWLRPQARKVWEVITKQLIAMNVIGQTDVGLLARYCQTFVKWREAEEYIQEHGSVQMGKEGESIHPFATLAVKYGEQLKGMERDLGLSPAARAGLAKSPPQKKDAKDRFFDKDKETA